MRYGPEHKAQTRAKIVQAAAKVFRRRGFQAAGVDEVMGEAGLTAGGFYAHFASKEDLFAEAFLETLRAAKVLRGTTTDDPPGTERVKSIAKIYLSPAHRTRIEEGCMLPPLLADLPRQSAAARDGFEAVLKRLLDDLQENFPEAEAERRWDHALATIALLIGGMSLARAVADDALAERILQACRTLIESSLDAPIASPTPNTLAKKKSPGPRRVASQNPRSRSKRKP